jgi:hypothetical protein
VSIALWTTGCRNDFRLLGVVPIDSLKVLGNPEFRNLNRDPLYNQGYLQELQGGVEDKLKSL